MTFIKSIIFSIYTIGCKTNQAESDDIARQLVLRGCRQAEVNSASDTAAASDSRAIDYIIINTCTVTAAADRKAKQLIRKLKSASPKSKVIVTGCFAELNSEAIKEIHADYIFSNSRKNEIADLICNADHAGYIKVKPATESESHTAAISGFSSKPDLTDIITPKPVTESELHTAAATSGFSSKPDLTDIITPKPATESEHSSEIKSTSAVFALTSTSATTAEPQHIHSRAFVKIQDGCQQGCSYCIVPMVRGPYLSTDPEKIIADIKNLVNCGHDEIVLTGIHIGKFGVDLLSKRTEIKTLPKLVLAIIENTGVKRLRLSSMEINEIDESLIGVMRDHRPGIAPHLHIPLQSGSDSVLRAMNRKYDSSFFISAVEHIKKAIPDITITTDIIVGFPGETDEDFIKTVEMVKNMDFSRLHVFKYSKRPATKAADMGGHLQEKTKTERSRILRELGLDQRNRFINKNINRKLDVVCEEYDTKSGIAGGISENYIKVYFDLNLEDYKLKKGKILKVSAKSLYEDGLYGILI